MKVKVIKIGGKLIEDDRTLGEVCKRLKACYPNCIVVHGGGNMATALAASLGVENRMHDGRRITDKAMLDIAVMVYAGFANKKIVAELLKNDVNACGLSGCDMGLVIAEKRESEEIDWGFVGDIKKINAEVFTQMLKDKIMPVISPISCTVEGQLLNTNADNVASSVAIALSGKFEVELVYCFDKAGVLEDINDETSVIAEINLQKYTDLKKNNRIHSGMLPKLENAFKTLEAGVDVVRITNYQHLDGGSTVIK
ncbi:MAG: acetylglutamate kinase [Culturomica sp.]|jgi:acetylglutamate kinase|nr:acetylglutamate kinase [Culturomica sp.]